jgi:hypothetical protein
LETAQEDVTAQANEVLMALVKSTSVDFDLGPVINVGALRMAPRLPRLSHPHTVLVTALSP